ncbi:hypothetical protein GCM10010304_17330 [Streptomyces roseoviolaceus]
MDLPDPHRSRAVLIGVDKYSHLDELPAVHRSVERLAELLRASDLWGLPKRHCIVLHNPKSTDEVLDVVHDAAKAAKAAFLVYFAGHGLVSGPKGELLLALKETDVERRYRALPYDSVRHELIDTCTATQRVVVLDCCYSGRALEGYMSPPDGLATLASIDRTYVMTSTSETRLSQSPEDEEFTAFSGELIKAVDEGVPHAPDPLELSALFQHVRSELVAKGRPVPQERARNGGDSIALTHNRWQPLSNSNRRPAPPLSPRQRQVESGVRPSRIAKSADVMGSGQSKTASDAADLNDSRTTNARNGDMQPRHKPNTSSTRSRGRSLRVWEVLPVIVPVVLSALVASIYRAWHTADPGPAIVTSLPGLLLLILAATAVQWSAWGFALWRDDEDGESSLGCIYFPSVFVGSIVGGIPLVPALRDWGETMAAALGLA